MAYADLQPKREFIEQLFLEAKIWRLDHDTYRSPDDITNWEHSFMMSFDDRTPERDVIRDFRIIWRADDDTKGPEWPRFGVAGNIEQLKLLMQDGRIRRDEIEISQEIWDEILELDEVIAKEEVIEQNSVDQDSDSVIFQGHFKNSDSSAETQSGSLENESDISATPDHILEALDKIVVFLTGPHYNTFIDIGAKYAAYVDGYDFNKRVMATFYDRGRAYLPKELERTFKSGIFTSWKVLLQELRYHFGCDESRETILDLFADLTTIAMDNIGTRSKFTLMRNKISKLFITNPSEFLSCEDSYYTKTEQTKCEEYSPMVNTLLTCIVYILSPLPKSKWTEIHDDYFRLMREKPTYKGWHKKRFHIYESMDMELKEANGGEMLRKVVVPKNLIDKCNQKAQIEFSKNDVNRDKIFNCEARNQNLAHSSRGNRNPNLIGQFRANNEIFNPKCKIDYGKPKNFGMNLPSRNNHVKSTSRWENSNLIWDTPPKCTHCTRHLGKTVRHNGPYQGRGDKCLFDIRGLARRSICVRREHKNQLKNVENEDCNGGIEYTETKNCIYIHSISVDKNENSFVESKGFGESRGRAKNQSRQREHREEKLIRFRAKNQSRQKDERNFIEANKEEPKVQERTKNGMSHINYMKTIEDCEREHREEKVNRFCEEAYERPNDLSVDAKGQSSGSIFTLNKPYAKYVVFESGKPTKRKLINWNPELECRFLNPDTPYYHRDGTVQLDSGAFASCIHVTKLDFCRILKYEKRDFRQTFSAAGQSLPLADYTVDIAMDIEDLGMFILRRVLVSTSDGNPFGNGFLLGRSDMNRLKVGIDFITKRVKFGVGPNRKWVKMKPEYF